MAHAQTPYPIGKILVGRYGQSEILRFELPWRVERYTPADGRPAVIEREMCTGPLDDSPHHSTYPTGYDSACSCCWLNIPHTEAKHRACLGEVE